MAIYREHSAAVISKARKRFRNRGRVMVVNLDRLRGGVLLVVTLGLAISGTILPPPATTPVPEDGAGAGVAALATW